MLRVFCESIPPMIGSAKVRIVAIRFFEGNAKEGELYATSAAKKGSHTN